MLTVDFDALEMRRGALVLDLGCGGGRHSFEALRRGACVVSVDVDQAALQGVGGMAAAMSDAGEIPSDPSAWCVCGDALRLPFDDETFEVVIASEVLEHIRADDAAMSELSRVLKHGGRAAVSVPRWWPERMCWWLSSRYHSNHGGHVRIYTARILRNRLRRAGLTPLLSHHAHALHSPYWWLKCAVGVDREHRLVGLYRRFLEWDIESRPPLVRRVERALDPVLGKSLVLYLRKQHEVVGAG